MRKRAAQPVDIELILYAVLAAVDVFSATLAAVLAMVSLYWLALTKLQVHTLLTRVCVGGVLCVLLRVLVGCLPNPYGRARLLRLPMITGGGAPARARRCRHVQLLGDDGAGNRGPEPGAAVDDLPPGQVSPGV